MAGEQAQPTEQAKVVLLAVGGRRHGQEITVGADDKSWVDLLTAQTYYRNRFKYVRRDPANPMSVSLRTAWVCDVLVHESIYQDQALAQQWWMALSLERLFAAFGRQVPLSEVMGNVPPESPNGRAGQHG
jgi:hypothetical protein